jgi:hypothetical protein
VSTRLIEWGSLRGVDRAGARSGSAWRLISRNGHPPQRDNDSTLQIDPQRPAQAVMGTRRSIAW